MVHYSIEAPRTKMRVQAHAIKVNRLGMPYRSHIISSAEAFVRAAVGAFLAGPHLG